MLKGTKKSKEEQNVTQEVISKLENYYVICKKLENLPTFLSNEKKDVICSLKAENITAGTFKIIKDDDFNEELTKAQVNIEDSNLKNYLFICKVGKEWVTISPFSFDSDGVSVILDGQNTIVYNVIDDEKEFEDDDNEEIHTILTNSFSSFVRNELALDINNLILEDELGDESIQNQIQKEEIIKTFEKKEKPAKRVSFWGKVELKDENGIITTQELMLKISH